MKDPNVAWATLAAAVAVSALLIVRSSNGPGTFIQLYEQQFRLNSTRAARHCRPELTSDRNRRSDFGFRWKGKYRLDTHVCGTEPS
jgi:hypothetical protein